MDGTDTLGSTDLFLQKGITVLSRRTKMRSKPHLPRKRI